MDNLGDLESQGFNLLKDAKKVSQDNGTVREEEIKENLRIHGVLPDYSSSRPVRIPLSRNSHSTVKHAPERRKYVKRPKSENDSRGLYYTRLREDKYWHLQFVDYRDPVTSPNCARCEREPNQAGGAPYMVQDELWEYFVPEDLQLESVCSECLEILMGRELRTGDFTEDTVNYVEKKDFRLKDRMGIWFSDVTGPFETAEEEEKAKAEIERRRNYDTNRAPDICGDCRESTEDEFYMVQSLLWISEVPFIFQGQELCIGCLENHIGRKLVPRDFTDCSLNAMPGGSERLIDRKNGRIQKMFEKFVHDSSWEVSY